MNLKEFCKSKGTNINKIAEQSGIPPTTLYTISSGKLNGERLRQIANKYGVTVDFLLGTSAYSKSDDAKKRTSTPPLLAE